MQINDLINRNEFNPLYNNEEYIKNAIYNDNTITNNKVLESYKFNIPNSINENSIYLKNKKNMKKLCLPQSNYEQIKNMYKLVNATKNDEQIVESLRRKYKTFGFCLNKIFNQNNFNDIITLNENIEKNKNLLSLFKKKDIINLNIRNFSFFMNKIQFEKIDYLIIKRIKISLDLIANKLGINCSIDNVKDIIQILKKAFTDRLRLIWPFIMFSNQYRLDKYFYLLGKHKMNFNVSKNLKLSAKQNINSLILYFNQRIADDKCIEFLKKHIKTKKRRKKIKNKENIQEDMYNLIKSLKSFMSLNNTNEQFINIETAENKANEFAFVGYNQKRLLTQITPYDFKTVLNYDISKILFTVNWRKLQEEFINILHFDMVPDTTEIKKYFENMYIRYMGYDKKNELKDSHSGKEKLKGLKENTHISDKKRIKRRNVLNDSNELVIKKARKKNTRTKSKKNDISNENEIHLNDTITTNELNKIENIPTQNLDNYLNTNMNNEKCFINMKEKQKKERKPRKPREKKNKKINEVEDVTVIRSDANTIVRASLDFMNPTTFAVNMNN